MAAGRTVLAHDTNGNDKDEDFDNGEDCDSENRIEEYYKAKYIEVPEPEPYEPRTRTACCATAFAETFSGNNLQVIVKLANIHLTPEKPTYDGDIWQIEVRSALAIGLKVQTA